MSGGSPPTNTFLEYRSIWSGRSAVGEQFHIEGTIWSTGSTKRLQSTLNFLQVAREKYNFFFCPTLRMQIYWYCEPSWKHFVGEAGLNELRFKASASSCWQSYCWWRSLDQPEWSKSVCFSRKWTFFKQEAVGSAGRTIVLPSRKVTSFVKWTAPSCIPISLHLSSLTTDSDHVAPHMFYNEGFSPRLTTLIILALTSVRLDL